MRPIIKNGADEDQVKEAERKVKTREDKEVQDLRFILSSVQGRRFVWRLLKHCSVFKSIWKPSAEIHHLAGKQDVGHFILAEVIRSREDALLEMMKESKENLYD